MQLAKHVKQGQLIYFTKQDGELSVSENEYYRWLAFGDVIQSVMHKRNVWQLTLPHQTAMLLPLLFSCPKSIIECGLGGGNFARFLTHLQQDIKFTSIECNKSVIDCFEKYFNPDDTKITIIKDRAEHWLENHLEQAPDWLICDVYQQQLVDFKDTIALLSTFVNAIDSTSCLSINLPDASDQEVNLCLTVLQQLQSNHRIVYFHVPNYLNIVIHLVPEHWRIENVPKKNKYSYLAKPIYQKWRGFWQHFKEI
jgi:spermidine synthase